MSRDFLLHVGIACQRQQEVRAADNDTTDRLRLIARVDAFDERVRNNAVVEELVDARIDVGRCRVHSLPNF